MSENKMSPFVSGYTSLPSSQSHIILGSRDGEVVRALTSLQCSPVRFRPSDIYELSLLLVLVLAPRVFLRFSGFTSSIKTNTPNSNLTRIEGPLENQADVASSLNIVILFISLFVHLFTYLFVCFSF